MTEKEYRYHPNISNSSLSYVKNLILNQPTNIDYSYFKVGRYVDKLILGQHFKDELEIDHEQLGQAHEIKKAFDKTLEKDSFSWLKKIIELSLKQHPVFGSIEFDNLVLNTKCLHDIYDPVTKMSIDLKTTDCKTTKQFIDACKHFDYDRQSFWYSETTKSNISFIIGIQKKYPYNIYLINSEKHLKMHTEGKQKAYELSYVYDKLFLL